MAPELIGIIGIFVFLILLALRVPIAYSFAIVGFAGFGYLRSFKIASSLFGSLPFTWGTYYPFLCLPLFVLMGSFAATSGITGELFKAGQKWLGRFPGGLAHATIAASTAFAACTGSSMAASVTMGKIAIPEMRKCNYSPALATGTVAAGGTLGILIPPSSALVIYGILAEQSIGRLFIAGILPGILISLLYMLQIYFRCRINPEIAGKSIHCSWKEKLQSLKGIWGVLAVFALVIGGIYGGIFTPVEAGGVGAFTTFCIALFRRKMSWASFKEAMLGMGRIFAMIFMIFIGAMIFNTFLTISGLPALLSNVISGLQLPRYIILILILLLYIPLGMLLEPMSMLVLTLPILLPTLDALQFDLIWIGILMVLMMEVGLITPPVGLNCFAIKGIVSQDVPLETIFRGVFPFVIIHLVGVALIVAFPQIALFLSAVMK
jgi:tripartite ATP-independent transporter DctM subunit